jgi:hypothetical protein
MCFTRRTSNCPKCSSSLIQTLTWLSHSGFQKLTLVRVGRSSKTLICLLPFSLLPPIKMSFMRSRKPYSVCLTKTRPFSLLVEKKSDTRCLSARFLAQLLQRVNGYTTRLPPPQQRQEICQPEPQSRPLAPLLLRLPTMHCWCQICIMKSPQRISSSVPYFFLLSVGYSMFLGSFVVHIWTDRHADSRASTQGTANHRVSPARKNQNQFFRLCSLPLICTLLDPIYLNSTRI